MQQDIENQPQPTQQDPLLDQTRKPDDRGSVNVDGFVRIFDPNTQQVFLETRT